MNMPLGGRTRDVSMEQWNRFLSDLDECAGTPLPLENQGKLVRVVQGTVLDVAVDDRSCGVDGIFHEHGVGQACDDRPVIVRRDLHREGGRRAGLAVHAGREGDRQLRAAGELPAPYDTIPRSAT